MIIADGKLTLPSGLIAGYHMVTSISIHFSEEKVTVGISSWGSEDACKRGYAPDKQIASIGFAQVPNLKGAFATLRDMLFEEGGPLYGATLRT